MSDHAGKVAVWIAVALLFYLLSPPLVYKASLMMGSPMSDTAFSTLYAPLFPLIEHVKPYAKLIEAEAVLLNLN